MKSSAQLIPFKKLIKEKEEGFSLIELVVVVSVLAVLSAIAIPTFSCFQRKVRATAALAAMKQIQAECAINKEFNMASNEFTPNNLNSYQIESDGSNNCSGASGTGLIRAIPNDTNILPTFLLASNTNELTYDYRGQTGKDFSECMSSICISAANDPTPSPTPDPDSGIGDIVSFGPSGGNSQLSCNGKFITIKDRDDSQVYRQSVDTGEKVLITSTKDGVPSTGDSQEVKDISCDGRYALVTLDEYGSVDFDGLPGADSNENDRGALYRKDLETGEVVRVDTLSNGEKKRNKWSIDEAVLSSDGRFVLFETPDVQLAGLEEAAWSSEDWSRTLAYRKDMNTGELSVVVTKPDGSPGDGFTRSGGYGNGVSDDGSKVTFIYDGDDLVPGVSGKNVYVKDFETNTVSLVSSDSQGNRLDDFGNWGSGSTISPDGSKVVFTSNGENGQAQIMMKDLSTGQLNVISKNTNGIEGNGYSGGGNFNFSGDNKYLVYNSSASNIVDNDTNGHKDIYVYDISSGETKRLLADKANSFNDHLWEPQITKDGKYISFRSRTTGITEDGGSSGNSETYMVKSPFFE